MKTKLSSIEKPLVKKVKNGNGVANSFECHYFLLTLIPLNLKKNLIKELLKSHCTSSGKYPQQNH